RRAENLVQSRTGSAFITATSTGNAEGVCGAAGLSEAVLDPPSVMAPTPRAPAAAIMVNMDLTDLLYLTAAVPKLSIQTGWFVRAEIYIPTGLMANDQFGLFRKNWG